MARTQRTRTDLHALIQNLEARCRARAAGLPDEARPPDSWTAVLFRVEKQLLLTPLEQIAEVLELPVEITRVPGTKPWLLGVANNRGTLLPIYDLASLITGGPPRMRKRVQDGPSERRREHVRSRERVLVVRQDDLPCGLVVSEAVGMRYIRNSDRVAGNVEGWGSIGRYVETAYQLEGQTLPVIQLKALIADPLLNAALN
ncbi:chemotaxis protein CheW [Thermochromatium tepidum]|uniref:Chemotaxis protein CheW n=1 Tax=Thermochromatium tepidum ATCC 43061 TaxID=316276 RepID=A0A6I6ECS7_THETI|nr:chemotaxis protein CheW [Thermochromatium tepidum]QGU31970.1 chemotaxis protein CheW [Thermochromatium tepidum ATCC 43061]